MQSAPTTTRDLIIAEIKAKGPISVVRYMELALYHPQLGYYSSAERQVGKRGDFYTSVSVGPLFGRMLGFKFAQWLSLLSASQACPPHEPNPHPSSLPSDGRGRKNCPALPAPSPIGWERAGVRVQGKAPPIETEKHWDHEPATVSDSLSQDTPFQILEAGAHHGELAFDLLTYLQEAHPWLFERLEYLIIEPLSVRKAEQQKKLHSFGPRVTWKSNLKELKPNSINGLIISNELLDAMPVHQLRWNAQTRQWAEWGIASKNDELVWTPLSNLTDAELLQFIPDLPPQLEELLPDGFCYEVSLAAVNWWKKAASLLNQGYLFAADYGLEDLEFFHPQRSSGTLRAYHKHHGQNNIFNDPGNQDITAHVNFTVIRDAGNEDGLCPYLYATQANFLSGIFKEITAANDPAFAWNSETVRQFQTLTHPEHLGRTFKVLVQGKFQNPKSQNAGKTGL